MCNSFSRSSSQHLASLVSLPFCFVRILKLWHFTHDFFRASFTKDMFSNIATMSLLRLRELAVIPNPYPDFPSCLKSFYSLNRIQISLIVMSLFFYKILLTCFFIPLICWMEKPVMCPIKGVMYSVMGWFFFPHPLMLSFDFFLNQLIFCEVVNSSISLITSRFQILGIPVLFVLIF